MNKDIIDSNGNNPESEERRAKERSKWRLGIRQHLTMLILLLFIPLLGIEAFSAFREYNTQRQEVLQSQLVNARSISRTLTAFINDQVNNNRALVVTFKNSASLTTDQGNTILKEYRQLLPYLTSYRLLGKDGTAIYSDPPDTVGYNFSDAKAFQKIADGAEYAVSDLRPSDANKNTPVVAILTPVFAKDNSWQGAIGAFIDVTKLGQILDVKIGVKGRGSISIHDTQANLIYNSLFPEFPYQNRANRATESVLAALQGKETVQESVKSTLDGLDKMGASVPISSPVNWSVSVAEPIEDALSPTLNNIIPRVVSFGVVALLAVILAWLYSRYLARPLVDLRVAALAFGQGELDKRIVRPKHLVAELEQMGESFNEMADKIAQETRARDTFLGQAAHELRTPITVIKGTSQLIVGRQRKAIRTLQENLSAKNPAKDIIEQDLKERETLLKQLGRIEYQSNRMSELINRLLDLTRLQSGRMEYQFETVNFLPLLERCLEAASQLTEPTKHPITLSVSENTPFSDENKEGWLIQADTARLEQVVLNLLENAIKYSPQGGPIHITLEHRSAQEILPTESLELTIRDNGIGIESPDLNRLFGRYYRAKNAHEQVGGLGLGLYISYEIVKQHGGRMWPESPGLNQGSTFHLVLPLQQEAREISRTEVKIPSLL